MKGNQDRYTVNAPLWLEVVRENRASKGNLEIG